MIDPLSMKRPGRNNTMPKCSCQDFRHTSLLCKHFFAVFKHNEDWQRDVLPESYRHNPHLCLDNAVIFESTSHLNPNSIIEDPTHSPLPTFVPQPQMQPLKSTSLSQYNVKEMHLSTGWDNVHQ